MPKYRITAPDGGTYDVTAPDGATQEQVLAYAQAHHASTPADVAASDAKVRTGNTPGGLRAFANGASFNFADKLDAAGAAGETAVSRALGGKTPYTPRQAYDAVVGANHDREAEYAKAHPVKSVAAGVGGSLMAPGILKGGKWVAGAKSMLPMMGRSALVTGAAGAAYGAGGANPGDEVKDAVEGDLTGSVMGLLFPPAAALAGKALRKVAAPIIDPLAKRLAPMLDELMNGPTAMNAPAKTVAARTAATVKANTTAPQLRAAQAIKNAADRDAKAGFTPRTGVAPMHSGGDNMAALYEVAAKSPGPARQMIRQGVKDSRAATYNEVEADLGNSLGGRGDYFATLDQLTKDRASNAAEGMSKLGRHLVTLDENSVSALRSDLAKGAMKKAATNGLASTDPDVRAGAASLNRLSAAVLDKPSAQTMTVREAQDISEALLSAADTAYKGGDGSTGKALKGLGKAIRENARTPDRGGFSEYDDWLKQYGTDSENKRALELGSNAMTSGLKNSPEAVARELADMGAGALDHYRKGVGEALIDKVRGARGDVKVMRGLLDDRNLAARVRLAFPDDKTFADFLGAADGRVAQADLNNRYMGGSGTGPMQAVREDLEREGADVAGIAGDALTGNVRALAGRSLKGALKALPRKASSAITDPDANAALGRSAMDPDEVTRLLNMLQASKRIALAPKTTQALVTATPAASNRR